MSQVSSKAFVVLAPASTKKLTAGTTSSSVQVHTGHHRHIRIYNKGSVEAYVECGGSAVAATIPAGSAGSMPIAPGSVEIIGCPEGYVAAIVAAGTADLFITPGFGS